MNEATETTTVDWVKQLLPKLSLSEKTEIAKLLRGQLEPLVKSEIAEISRLIFEELKSYSFGIDGVTDFGANKKEFTEIIQKTLTGCIPGNYTKISNFTTQPRKGDNEK